MPVCAILCPSRSPMRLSYVPRFPHVLAAGATLAFSSLVLSGCGLSGGTDIQKPSTLNPAQGSKTFLSGNLHGGQQPVPGSTVKLWAAGTTGTGAAAYGANATLLATATTASDGSFSFNNTSGVSPCTPGQYLYVTAQGGMPDGANTNSALAMMAALPTACDANTGNQYVWINEVTTVAAVWSLQQFMSIAPGGATPWQIGAPSTNVAGLANAFLMSGNLASVATGTTAVSSTNYANTTTLNSVVYTTVINPDFTKINTLADILATCVNTTDSSSTISNTCTSLLADTTPSGSTAGKDTLDAAFYLATNAAGLTMNKGSYNTSPQYLCSNYIPATPPFQPTMTCSSSTYPNDWMIGISYKTTNNANTTTNTLSPGSIAVDASGNIWLSTYNSGSTAGQITGMDVAGHMLITPVTSTNIVSNAGWSAGSYAGTNPYPLGGARNDSLAIDTNGNIWSANYYTTSYNNTVNTTVSGGTYQAPIARIDPTTGSSTGYLVGATPVGLAIDGSNNVYVTDNTTSGASQGSSPTNRYYASMLAAGTTADYTSFYTGVGRFTALFTSIQIDGSGNQYAIPFNGTCSNATLYRYNSGYLANTLSSTNASSFTSDGAAVTLSSSSSPTTCAQYGAPDGLGNIWATSSGNLEYIVPATGTTAPSAPTSVTTFTASSGTTNGGLASGTGVAIDGLGNVWVANNVGTTTGGVTELAPSNNGTAVTAKSPAGTSIYGFGSQYAYPHAIAPVIDRSGNIWIEVQAGSYLYGLVGGAGPVVTPKVLAVKNSLIGQRP